MYAWALRTPVEATARDGGLSFFGFGNGPQSRIRSLYFISLNRTNSVVHFCLLGFLLILI